MLGFCCAFCEIAWLLQPALAGCGKNQPSSGVSSHIRICATSLPKPSPSLGLAVVDGTSTLGGFKMTKVMRTWWHELNTWEPEVALAFYSRTLGWEFEDAPLPDGSNYWIARKEGRPMGGIFGLSEPDYVGIPAHWMTYMAVSNMHQAERAAAFAGGQVTRPAAHIPGVGKLAVVTDSTGALIGFIEPDSLHALAEAAA